MRVQLLAQAAQEAEHAADHHDLRRQLDERVLLQHRHDLVVGLRDRVDVDIARIGGGAQDVARIGVAERHVALLLIGLGAEADAAEGIAHLLVIGREDRVDQDPELAAELLRQLLRLAEVQEHDLRPGPHQQIAGVRVRVEEAVAQDLLRVRLHQHPRHLAAIDACRCQPFAVGDLDAFHELHHQHGARRVFPVDVRHGHGRRIARVRGDALGVAPLVDEVQLFRDVRAQLVGHEAIVDAAVQAVEHADEERQVRQVDIDDPSDARVLHLHGGLAAIVQRRAVHLRQRRRRDRLLVEAREHRVQRLAQLRLDHTADHRERLRRHAVL